MFGVGGDDVLDVLAVERVEGGVHFIEDVEGGRVDHLQTHQDADGHHRLLTSAEFLESDQLALVVVQLLLVGPVVLTAEVHLDLDSVVREVLSSVLEQLALAVLDLLLDHLDVSDPLRDDHLEELGKAGSKLVVDLLQSLF